MGNNAAFTSFEASVMACYDHGVLDLKLLKKLMEPYREMDIDSGGMDGILSKRDKLDVVDVVLKTFGKKLPVKPKLPAIIDSWSEEDYRANDAYEEKRWRMFNKIASNFGWG